MKKNLKIVYFMSIAFFLLLFSQQSFADSFKKICDSNAGELYSDVKIKSIAVINTPRDKKFYISIGVNDNFMVNKSYFNSEFLDREMINTARVAQVLQHSVDLCVAKNLQFYGISLR
ncbi:hypothetical protein [Bartonella sp. 1-1C]|uniref:hypothetical protein n=1 Tax=Bartonella sp. 1-1C TaxID=515256 RepID=UPI000C058737|nr:hypothetical protein [Bartonella sp. 1-1C]ATO57322.1 hypothetical protein B11Cv2_005520 [Bartonella sp. 1-1C]